VNILQQYAYKCCYGLQIRLKTVFTCFMCFDYAPIQLQLNAIYFVFHTSVFYASSNVIKMYNLISLRIVDISVNM